MSAKYTFLPYFRKGLINRAQINEDEDSSDRPEIEIKLNLNVGDPISKPIQLLAPRDITGLNPAAITKTFPEPGSLEMMPGDLAYIEFREEDLPWRFSPEHPESNQLMPWLMLLTFKEEELAEEHFQSLPLPSFKAIAGTPMLSMDFSDAWAFAHVQINGETDDPIQYMKQERNTRRSVSRILCPRRLDPSTRYIAFLVPTFKAGQLAGLGRKQEAAGEPSTSLSDPGDAFPFYYRWTFTTAGDGSFEDLARRLKPVSSESIALPTINISSLQHVFPDQQLNKTDWEVPCLFLPPNKEVEAFTEQGVKEKLSNRLNSAAEASQAEGEQEFVPLPFNGRNYATEPELSATRNNWLDTINLDPRYRVIVQIGRNIVREHQEDFMDLAWDQAGEALEELNGKMRRAHLAARLSRQVWDKHLEPRSENELLGFSRPLQQRIGVTDMSSTTLTLAYRIAHSVLSKGATDATFRKVIRKAKRNQEAPDDEKKVGKWIDQIRLNKAKAAEAKGPLSSPGLQFNEDFLEEKEISIGDYAGDSQESTEKYLSAMNYYDYKSTIPLADEEDVLSSIKTILKEATDPEQRQMDLLSSEYTIELEADAPLQALGLTPSFPGTAIYNYLRGIAPQLLFPKVNDVPDNSIMVLEPNPAFLESIMVGVNQEMSEELKWREYPCNLAATFFRQFWDYTDSGVNERDDILPIEEWGDGPLGEHLTNNNQSESLVILIKSRLLEKFPNTVLYLQKAEIQDKGRRGPATEVPPVFPSFRAGLPPDMLMLRFDGISAATVAGSPQDAGYFLVFQERPGETRFGLDRTPTTADATELGDWDHLSWPNIPGEVLKMEHQLSLSASDDENLNAVNWNSDSDAAQIAWILLQKPVQLAIHGAALF